MFIKKDRRRIDEILEDPEDSREQLLLSKRVPEFQGSTRVLLREIHLNAFKNLKILNLYDNAIAVLPGVNILAQTPIEEINLGCNKLTSLPLEFGQISTLKSLWLDDNEFDEFPVSICRISGLEALRLSGNKISFIPDVISNLSKLEILALDNNDLSEIFEGILKIVTLKKLWLR
jgi:Leucine-rich repeat (LRR) protein